MADTETIVMTAGTGSYGQAPMVVDPPITEAAAARQLGLAILADTGWQTVGWLFSLAQRRAARLAGEVLKKEEA